MHLAVGAKVVILGVVGLFYKLVFDEIGQILEVFLEPCDWTFILSYLFGGVRCWCGFEYLGVRWVWSGLWL